LKSRRHKANLQGSEVVKEDLIDEIVKESSPYRAPDKAMKRSDLSSPLARPKVKSYEPNE